MKTSINFLSSVLYISIWILISAFLYIRKKIVPFSENSLYSYFPDLFLLYAIILIINLTIIYWLVKKKKFPLLSFSLFTGAALIVFMYYFYMGQKEDEWNIENRLSFMEVIIALISSIIVVWGGYLALRQIKESVYTNKIAAQTNKLSSFKMMVDLLQEKKAREMRRIVFGLFDDNNKTLKKYENWTKKEKKAVHYTLACLDQVGLMIKYDLLDYEFLEGWFYSIYKCIFISNVYKEMKADEYKYITTIDGKVSTLSNYYLGIEELIARKSKNIIYDFEDKTLSLK